MKRIFSFICLWIFSTVGYLPAQETTVEVWAVPSIHKVRPDDRIQTANLVWSGETKTISLAGAKNEHVPFQVVISTPPPPTRYDPPASGFWVEVSDLVSAESRIAREQVKLFVEHVILCYGASSPVGATGFWPDALAPLTDPFDMAAQFRRAVKNRAVWIDVTVPEETPAGTYTGTIRVSQNGATLDELKLALEVYDFALPRETHLLTHIGVFDNWFIPQYDVGRDSPELRQITRTYYDFLYANRMEPWFNELLQPEIEAGSDGSLDLDFDEELYDHYMNELQTKRVILEAVPSELRDQEEQVNAYLQKILEYFKENGWADRLVFNSPIDEPNTAQQYADTRRWATLGHEAAPGVPFLITESPVTDNPEWGSLSGFANNFSIHGDALNEPAVKRAIREEQAKGGELSWYISCDQLYPQPNYFIDAPAMDPVMIPWITWRYGLDGILYWAVNYWTQTPNPWLDPVTFLSGFLCSGGHLLNGEGSLLYPGNSTRRYTGQQNVEGPVSSIRFELLREGIEDYEYLWLLKSLGDEEFANEAVRNLVVDVSSFSRNVEELLTTRERLARRIEALTR